MFRLQKVLEGLHEIEAMSHDAVNNELRSIFRWNYAGITRANYLLENKNKIDFEGKDKIIAEATFFLKNLLQLLKIDIRHFQSKSY